MKNEFESYFFSKLKHDTDINNCYFCMPSNDCFTYCINELKHALENQLEENIKNNYVLELSKWFFSFLENDPILKKVDSLKFSKLLLLLKDLSEGKQCNKKETVTNLVFLRNSLTFHYFSRIKDELLSLNGVNEIDYSFLDCLIELFLNECLARDIDIRFINKTIEWYENGVFQSFQSYLCFFVEKKHISYDIYIPLLNYKAINEDVFEQNGQKIVQLDNDYYLHIYENGSIDYYRIITSHMIRINSIFNTIKLYTSSEIDYDYKKNILIKIDCDEIEKMKEVYLPFSNLIKYKGVNPYAKFMSNSIQNLNVLYDVDRDLYHKILNIIGYSEKNNDSINSSSYVDSWIALESLYSLNSIMFGFKSVKTLLPSFISSKIIINKLTYILKNGFKSSRISAENFIGLSEADTDVLAEKSSSFYYKRELLKMKNRLSSIKNLSKYYSDIEKRISIDLTRIYMLRNEYVHESKLSAFKSLEFYKLRNYLVLSIDLFFNMLDQRIGYDNVGGEIAYNVFSRLKDKNDLRRIFFIVSTEKRKYRNNAEILEIIELNDRVSMSDVIRNIVFNNNSIVKKFVKHDKAE